MELKDFIKAALADLIAAVDETKKELGKDGSLICPPNAPSHNKDIGLFTDKTNTFYQKVEFDIAVTAGEEMTQKGEVAAKIGIKVLSANANIDSSINSSNLTVSRIKFHVPIGLQCMDLKEK